MLRGLIRERLTTPVTAAVVVAAGSLLVGCTDDVPEGALTPALETEVEDIRGAQDLDDPYRGLLDAGFVEDLPAYVDQEVTVQATVVEVLSPRAFTVGPPTAPETAPVLVIAGPSLTDVAPDPGQVVVIAATPEDDLEPEGAVEELGLALELAALEPWDDEVVLLATAVEPVR